MFTNFFNIRKKTLKNGLIKDFSNMVFNRGVHFSKIENYSNVDLKEYVLDKIKLSCNVFSIYYDIYNTQNKLMLDSALVKFNIFSVEPGFVGREFNKTCSYRILYKGDYKAGLFEVLSGNGIFILEDERKIKNVKIIKVKKGDFVFVPFDYNFVMINSSENEKFVCLSVIGKNTKFVKSLQQQNGSAIYFAKVGFARNKNVEPSYKLENLEGDYLKDARFKDFAGDIVYDKNVLNFSKEKGLYNEFLEFPDKFNFLR